MTGSSRSTSLKLDAKTVTAVAAFVSALAGGVELRVQVGMLASKVDRIENELRARERLASNGEAEDEKQGQQPPRPRRHDFSPE